MLARDAAYGPGTTLTAGASRRTLDQATVAGDTGSRGVMAHRRCSARS